MSANPVVTLQMHAHSLTLLEDAKKLRVCDVCNQAKDLAISWRYAWRVLCGCSSDPPAQMRSLRFRRLPRLLRQVHSFGMRVVRLKL